MSLAKHIDEFGRDHTWGTSLVHTRNRLVDAIKNQSAQGSVWINIEDPAMVGAIMSTYGDAINRKILDSCMSEPHTMMEILSITGISQTTGYRKIMSLIKDHFLSAHHMVRRSGGKQVSKYIATFKELEFYILKNQELIRLKFQD